MSTAAEPVPDPDVPDPDLPDPKKVRRRKATRSIVIIVLSLIAAKLIIGFVGQIDWSQVYRSFSKISWWQVLILIAVLGVRQVFNAIPLATFVPGLGLNHSMQNDVAANVAGTVTPPPGDMVVRIAMFNSWNVNPVDGMAGVTMNMLNFYAVRLLTPVVGLAIFTVAGIERHRVAWALLCALGAVALLLVLAVVLRAEDWADRLGRGAAVQAQRFKATADPDKWSAAVNKFRTQMSEGFARRSAISVVALLLMVAVDSLILTLALRFVGVPASAVATLLIVGAFFTAYPLTTMPLFGLGVLDAVLTAAYVENSGIEYEPMIIAGLAIWRVVTIIGPMLAGGITIFAWRRQSGTDLNLWGRKDKEESATPAASSS